MLLDKLPAGTVSRKSRVRERTPLHCAVLRDRVEAIDILLKNGSSAKELDMRGDNVLIMAARLGRIKSLNYILENKLCDLEAISEEMGDTALTIGACVFFLFFCDCDAFTYSGAQWPGKHMRMPTR